MKAAEHVKSNNYFLDENHQGLLGALDELGTGSGEDWKPEAFLCGANLFFDTLEGHFSHEEILLRGAGFSDLEEHTVKHRELALNLRKSALAIDSYEAARDFVLQTRSEILDHEITYDQEYLAVLEQLPGHDRILIPWRKELETGCVAIDEQHRELAAHINRFHSIFFRSASRRRACSELRSIYDYTKLHFSKEEEDYAGEIDPDHIDQHKHLLNNLALLISEVENGGYELGNISGHLKYWFLNHVQFSDVPAFRKLR